MYKTCKDQDCLLHGNSSFSFLDLFFLFQDQILGLCWKLTENVRDQVEATMHNLSCWEIHLLHQQKLEMIQMMVAMTIMMIIRDEVYRPDGDYYYCHHHHHCCCWRRCPRLRRWAWRWTWAATTRRSWAWRSRTANLRDKSPRSWEEIAEIVKEIAGIVSGPAPRRESVSAARGADTMASLHQSVRNMR